MAKPIFKVEEWFDEAEFDRQVLALDKPNGKSMSELRREAGYKVSE